MSGNIITVANMKGGVGKTTTVVALSHALAADNLGTKVLVIDGDAQASASFSLAGDNLHTSLIDKRKTIDAYLEDLFSVKSEIKPSLERYICKSAVTVTHRSAPLNISIIASSPLLRNIERRLIHAFTQGGYDMAKTEATICRLLTQELATLRSQFDYIVIDSAPGISLLTEASIRLADLVVVPTIPDYLSVLGLNGFTHNVWRQLDDGHSALPRPPLLPHVLISRRQKNAVHNKYVEMLQDRGRDQHNDVRVFQTIINEMVGAPRAIEKAANAFPTYLELWSSFPLDEFVEEIRDALLPLRQAAE